MSTGPELSHHDPLDHKAKYNHRKNNEENRVIQVSTLFIIIATATQTKIIIVAYRNETLLSYQKVNTLIQYLLFFRKDG